MAESSAAFLERTPLEKSRTEAAGWLRKVGVRRTPVQKAIDRLSNEWLKIQANSSIKPLLNSSPKKIIFVTGNGLNANQLGIESLLMESLRLRGHSLASFVCGMGVPSCEFNLTGWGKFVPFNFKAAWGKVGEETRCRTCVAGIKESFGAIGIPFFSAKPYLSEPDYTEAFEISQTIPFESIRAYQYDGINVGDHAFSSALRSTLRGTLNANDEGDNFTYRRQLMSSILLTKAFSRYLEQERPDRVVMVHGIYLTHGTTAEICRKKNIDVIVYGASYRTGTIWFSHRETYHKSLIKETPENYKGLILDAARLKRIDDYLNSKVSGTRDFVTYHPNPILDRAEIFKETGLDPNKPVISCFTNVIWDAQILYERNVFSDIFDWIFSTIDYFLKQTDKQLLIRVHPAEVKGGYPTRQPLYPEILKRYPNLPPHIKVVPPESDLSSYTIAEMSQLSIIHGTKMGLEIAARGIPVVVAGETFNRGKGYTFDAETREQYFEFLDRSETLPHNDPKLIENSKRFAYYLFFQRMLDMPLLTNDLYTAEKWGSEKFYNFDKMDSLMPGKDQNLDLICDSIAEMKPFLASWQ